MVVFHCTCALVVQVHGMCPEAECQKVEQNPTALFFFDRNI